MSQPPVQPIRPVCGSLLRNGHNAAEHLPCPAIADFRLDAWYATSSPTQTLSRLLQLCDQDLGLRPGQFDLKLATNIQQQTFNQIKWQRLLARLLKIGLQSKGFFPERCRKQLRTDRKTRSFVIRVAVPK